ncbi:MAG: hypothetical protein ABEH65_03800 [Halobacteriales archaeon]
MSTRSPTLGTCPRCEASIPPGHTLIEYETTEGSAVYAECPDCRDVVHPA